MVGKQGYALTKAASAYGARGISFLINPDYVREHHKDFIAIGENFSGSSPDRKNYVDDAGRVYHNLIYQAMEQTENDEVAAKYIPPEAIIGIVINTDRDITQPLIDFIRTNFQNKFIYIFDSEGYILNLQDVTKVNFMGSKNIESPPMQNFINDIKAHLDIQSAA